LERCESNGVHLAVQNFGVPNFERNYCTTKLTEEVAFPSAAHPVVSNLGLKAHRIPSAIWVSGLASLLQDRIQTDGADDLGATLN